VQDQFPSKEQSGSAARFVQTNFLANKKPCADCFVCTGVPNIKERKLSRYLMWWQALKTIVSEKRAQKPLGRNCNKCPSAHDTASGE